MAAIYDGFYQEITGDQEVKSGFTNIPLLKNENKKLIGLSADGSSLLPPAATR
jgi:hypothetical protein